MLKTYRGSCHCGEVRFEADIDLSEGTIRCNCSICAKLRLWSAIIPCTAFRLLSGADALSRYQFHTKIDEHYFCRHCGVRPFGTGNSRRWGMFSCVTISCLDDVEDQELAEAPVTYLDGRNDQWESEPEETRHL